MQDDFDNGMGLPDDEMIGGSLGDGDINDLGAGLEGEPELGGGEGGDGGSRSSGGARARTSAPRKASAPNTSARSMPRAMNIRKSQWKT